MKKLAEIQQDLAPALQKAEAIRLQQLAVLQKKRLWYIIPAVIVLAALAAAVYTREYSVLIAGAMLGGTIAWLIQTFAISDISFNFKWDFKRSVFQQFVQIAYPTVSFKASTKPSAAMLLKSGLVAQFDQYHAEDYFEGKTKNGSTYQFMQLNTFRFNHSQDENGRSVTTTSPLFSGLFFELAAPVQLIEDVVIFTPSPSQINSDHFDSWAKKAKFKKKSIKELYPDLAISEAMKDTYHVLFRSLDTAGLLLESGVLKALQNFNERWKMKAHCTWIGDKIYVSLPCRFDFFESKMDQSLKDPQIIRKLFAQTQICFHLLEDLSQLPFQQSIIMTNFDDNDNYDHLIDY